MGVHDTKKYKEVKKLLGIRKREPIFILRAQDITALENLDGYISTAAAIGCSQDFIDGAMAIRDLIQAWRVNNPEKMKTPD